MVLTSLFFSICFLSHGHMLTHEEDKPHKCRVPDCNRTYCDARSLKRHIENAHQNILAAIHEGGHDEYRNFLPDSAFVKTKELVSDVSLDSMDHNSPQSSSMDAEQPFHINQQNRLSTGHRLATTYTYVLLLLNIILRRISLCLDLMKKNLLNVIFVKRVLKIVQH